MTAEVRFEQALKRANSAVFLLRSAQEQVRILTAMEEDARMELMSARDAILEEQATHMDPHPTRLAR